MLHNASLSILEISNNLQKGVGITTMRKYQAEIGNCNLIHGY